jgi:hypothetical protein
MAVFSATDYDITINSVNLSDRLNSIELSVDVAELDTTNYDSAGWTELIGGRKSGTVSLSFMQDFAESEVEATIYPLIGTTTAIVIKPTSGSVSATNPSYTQTVLVKDWKPIPGVDPAGLPVASVSWPTSGAVVKGTGG